MSFRPLQIAAVLVAAALAPGCAGAQSGDGLPEDVNVKVFPRTTADGTRIGGLSGLAWDGRSDFLTALSDRGGVYKLRMEGGPKAEKLGQIKTRRGIGDPEALIHAREGAWHVAFEGGGGLGYYRGDALALLETPERLISIPAWRALTVNERVEAIALLDFGRILAIGEKAEGETAPAWILDGDRISSRRYPASGGYAPVDAILLRNGDVLVLERRFNGILPPFFSSRLALLPAEIADSAETVLPVPARYPLASDLPSENWEGMTLARGALWLVSDDNFQWPQRTLLARLPLERILKALRAGTEGGAGDRKS